MTEDKIRSYGLVGPIARASGVARDIRKLFPYAAYASINFSVPIEQQGDGYARLRILFAEAEQSAAIIGGVLSGLPRDPPAPKKVGCARGPRLWRWKRHLVRRSTGYGSTKTERSFGIA